jgi:hypothetical protein
MVLQASKGHKYGEAPGPIGILKSVMRHLPMCTKIFLTKVFNAIFRRQFFPTAKEHARMVSILKPAKEFILLLIFNPLLCLKMLARIAVCCVPRILSFDPELAQSCSLHAVISQ